MSNAAISQLNHAVKVAASTFKVGDNRFLSHATHEITVGGEHVGDTLVSLYDFGSAKSLKVARNWLARPNSYLAQYRKYLFRPEVMVAQLPPDTEVSGSGSGKVLIIDEIIVEPGYATGEYEKSVLENLVASYERIAEAILLPKWQSLGRRMGMGAEDQLHYFANQGFLAIDGGMMIRVGSQ